MGYILMENYGLPLGWSLGTLLGIWGGFLLGISARGKVGTPLGWGLLYGICVGFFVIFPCDIWLGARIGVQIGFGMGTVLNNCDSTYILLLFIDVLMSGFGKYFENSVSNLWLTVNSNFISWVHLA